MTRSMAPPPPPPQFQLMNLAPVTERVPAAVCHLNLSWRSGWAPQSRSTASKGMARSWSTLCLLIGARLRVGLIGAAARPDADALFHVEDVAGLGEAIDQSLG